MCVGKTKCAETMGLQGVKTKDHRLGVGFTHRQDYQSTRRLALAGTWIFSRYWSVDDGL